MLFSRKTERRRSGMEMGRKLAWGAAALLLPAACDSYAVFRLNPEVKSTGDSTALLDTSSSVCSGDKIKNGFTIVIPDDRGRLFYLDAGKQTYIEFTAAGWTIDGCTNGNATYMVRLTSTDEVLQGPMLVYEGESFMVETSVNGKTEKTKIELCKVSVDRCEYGNYRWTLTVMTDKELEFYKFAD